MYRSRDWIIKKGKSWSAGGITYLCIGTSSWLQFLGYRYLEGKYTLYIYMYHTAIKLLPEGKLFVKILNDDWRKNHSELYGLCQQLSSACSGRLAPRACRGKLLTQSSFGVEWVKWQKPNWPAGGYSMVSAPTKRFSRVRIWQSSVGRLVRTFSLRSRVLRLLKLHNEVGIAFNLFPVWKSILD